MLSPVEGTALAFLSVPNNTVPLRSIPIENTNLHPSSSSLSSSSSYDRGEGGNMEEFILSLAVNDILQHHNILSKQHLIILRSKEDIHSTEDGAVFIVAAVANQCFVYQMDSINRTSVPSFACMGSASASSTFSPPLLSSSFSTDHDASATVATFPTPHPLYSLKLVRKFYVGNDIILLVSVDGSNGAFLLATGTTVHQYILLRSSSLSTFSSMTTGPSSSSSSTINHPSSSPILYTYDICHTGIWTTPPDVLSSGRITSLQCSYDARYISVSCGDCLVILYHELNLPSYTYVPLVDTLHHSTGNTGNTSTTMNNNNNSSSSSNASSSSILGTLFRNRTNSTSSVNSTGNGNSNVPKLSSLILQHEDTIQQMEWKTDPVIVSSTEVALAVGTVLTPTFDSTSSLPSALPSGKSTTPTETSTKPLNYKGGFIGSLTWASRTNRSPYPLPYGVSTSPALLLVTTKNGNSYLWRENDPWNAVNFSQIITFLPPSSQLHTTTNNTNPSNEPSSSASTRSLLHPSSFASVTNNTIPPSLKIQTHWTWMRQVIGHDRVHWAWTDAIKPNIFPDTAHVNHILTTSFDKGGTIGRSRAGSTGSVLTTFHPTLTHARSRMLNRTLSIIGLFSGNKDKDGNAKSATDEGTSNSIVDLSSIFLPPLPHVHNHYATDPIVSVDKNPRTTFGSVSSLTGTHVTPLPRMHLLNSTIKEENIRKDGEVLDEVDGDDSDNEFSNNSVTKDIELSFRGRSDTIDYAPRFLWPSCGHDFHLHVPSGGSASTSVNTSPHTSERYTVEGIRTSTASGNGNDPKNPLVRRSNDALLGILNELPSRASTLDSEYILSCQSSLPDRNYSLPKETSQRNVLRSSGAETGRNDRAGVRLGLHRLHGATEGFESDVHVAEVAVCHFPLPDLHHKLAEVILRDDTRTAHATVYPLLQTTSVTLHHATTIHDARVAGSVAPSLAPSFSSVRHFDRSTADAFRLLGNTIDPVNSHNGTLIPSESVITDLASVASTVASATIEAPKFRTRVASAMATAAVCDAIDTMIDAVDLYDGRSNLHHAREIDGSGSVGRSVHKPTVLHSSEQKRSLPLRKVRRSINRGLNIRNRINRMPQVSYVTLLVHGNLYRPTSTGTTSSDVPYTSWNAVVEVTIEWGNSHTHSIVTRYHIVKFVPQSDIKSTDFLPVVGKDSGVNVKKDNELSFPSCPEIPVYHPSFIQVTLEQGRMDIASRSLAHIAWCLRRALTWQETAKYVLQKAKKQQANHDDHSEMWANFMAEALSTEKDLTKDDHKENEWTEEMEARTNEDNLELAKNALDGSSVLNVSVPNLPLSLLFASGIPSSPRDATTLAKMMEIKPLKKESLRNLRLWYTLHPFTTQLVPSSVGTTDTYPPPLTVADIDLLREYLPLGSIVIGNLTKNEQTNLRILVEAYVTSNGPNLSTPVNLSSSGNGESTPSGAKVIATVASSLTSGSVNSSTTASVDPAGKVTLVSAVIMDAGRKLFSTNSPHTPFPAGVTVGSNTTDSGMNSTPPSMLDNGMESLPWSACVTALISDSQDALIRTLLPAEVGVTWNDLAALKVPLWLRSDRELADIVERIGKTAFIAGGKDPYATVLPYLSLGLSKVSLVRNFFRLSPTHGKVYTFLANDFTQDRWKQAASKNAFALLAGHKYEAAAGFFLLAGKPGQAVRVLVQQRREPFMALAVARLALFNGSVNIPPVTNTPSTESSVLSTITMAAASTAYGGYDAAQVLKDATAEILAEARAKSQTVTNMSSYGASSSSQIGINRTSTVPTKSILGFGFDDDNDYVPPSSISTVQFVDGLPVRTSTDEDTVYRPPTKSTAVNTDKVITTGSASVAPSSTSSSSSSSNNLRISSRPDADIDPIGWVLDSEFKGLAEGKPTYAYEDNGKPNPLSNGAVNGLDKGSTKALEFILLWLTKKPMDAMTELLSFLGNDTKRAEHSDYRLPISASLLLDMPVWKRPQILKVLLTRLRKRLSITSGAFVDDNAYLTFLKANLTAQEIGAIGTEGGPTSMLASPVLSRTLTNTTVSGTKNDFLVQSLADTLLATLNNRIGSLLDASIDILPTREGIRQALDMFWNDTTLLRTLCTGTTTMIDKNHELSRLSEAFWEKDYDYAYIALDYERTLRNDDNSGLVNTFTLLIERILKDSNESIQESSEAQSVGEILDDWRWTKENKAREEKHIETSLRCLRMAKLVSLCFDTSNPATSKNSTLYTHAWVHLVFIAYGRHDWKRVTDLLRQGSGSYKGRKQSTFDTSIIVTGSSSFVVPSFASNLYHDYWLHSWGLRLVPVRSNGYFFIAGTLRSSVVPDAYGTEGNNPSRTNPSGLTIKTSASSSLSTTAISSTAGSVTKASGAGLKSHQIVSLEKWLTRYIAAAAGALVALQIQNVLYDSARESLPLLDSWYQRCTVVVTAAHSTVRMMMMDTLPLGTDTKSDTDHTYIWGENNGPRAHIITGLTGIPDTRTSMIAHGFDWEATQQAKDAANTVNNPGKGRKGTSTGANSGTGIRRRDSGIKVPSAHETNRNTNLVLENSSAWWADVGGLFHVYASPTTGPSSPSDEGPALVTLWKYLGGPGLLWMIGTERRALVRARARARSGFLPSVRNTDKIEIRGKSSLPVLQFSIFSSSGSLAEFTANASMTSTASPSYIRAGTSGSGRFILVAVEGTSMNTVVVGVGRLNNHMDPFQIVPLSLGSNKLPGSMVPNPLRLLNGSGSSIGGILSSSGSFSNLHHLTNNVTGSHVKQLLSGSLTRRTSNHTLNGHPHSGGHTENGTIVDHHASIPDKTVPSVLNPVPPPGTVTTEPSSGLSLLSRVKNLRFLGGKKSESIHNLSSTAVPTSTASHGQVIVPVVLSHGSLVNGTNIQRQESSDLVHRDNSNGDGSAFHIAVAPLPDVLLHTGAHESKDTMTASLPSSVSAKPPTVPPTAVTLTMDTATSSHAAPPQLNASTLPTAVWWRDQHEYALPFTLPPSSFDMHPTAPLYLRGGPKGTIAAISVTLEQPELVPEGATNDHTWLQYVHRLHSLYSYEPISTSIHTTNQPNPTASHSHHSLASSFFSSSRSSFSNLSAVGSTGSTSPREETATPWDEQILRVRWSPDGRNTIASFASGIVRTWDITSPDHPTAAMVLPTLDNGSSKLGKTKSTVEVRETENLSSWAATDFLCLSASARVLAVAGSPLTAYDKYSYLSSTTTGKPLSSSSAAQPSKIGHAPVGLEAGGMLHVTPVVLQDTIIGGTLHSSASNASTTVLPNTVDYYPLSGYGINLFDLRVGNSPYATAAPYPDFSGINVLCFDEASLSLIGGCTDGSLLVYDLRTSSLRAKVPGVPIIPVVPMEKTTTTGRTATVAAAVVTPSLSSDANLATLNAKSLARGVSYFSMVDNNMDTVKNNHANGSSHLTGPGDSMTMANTTGNSNPSGTDINCGFGHAGGITVITMHPTQRILVTGGEDGDIHLWSLPDLFHRATLPHIHTPKSAMDNHTGGKSGKHRVHGDSNNGSIIHTNDNLDYAKTNTGSGKVSSSSSSHQYNDSRRTGISSIAVTEEHIISAGYDGSIYAIPQRW